MIKHPFMSREAFEKWISEGGERTPLFPSFDYEDCKRRWETPLVQELMDIALSPHETKPD